MAFANSAITDIIATTIQSRSGELADNVLTNNALLLRLKEKGNVKEVSGGNVILEEIMYTDANQTNANSYSGYESLNVSPNSPISAAQFPFTQYYASVVISGLEMLQNSGKEAIIDMLDGRIEIAEKQLMNRIAGDVYLDGTGNSGKNITGLASLVADSPATGIVGGIDRSLWTFWRNQSYSGATNGGAAVSAANIQAYMTSAALSVARGRDHADLVIADANYFGFYINSLQAIQRVASDGDSKMVGAGFSAVKFFGGGQSADVVFDGGIGNLATANHMWFLNTDYLRFRPHRDRNFTAIGGERQSVNQDAIVKIMGWAGNCTIRGPQFCAVLKA